MVLGEDKIDCVKMNKATINFQCIEHISSKINVMYKYKG